MPNTVIQVALFDMGACRPFDLPLYIPTMSDRSLMSYAESAQRGQFERESTSAVRVSVQDRVSVQVGMGFSARSGAGFVSRLRRN
ncbi:hypothetical protein GCM10009576_090220 [Streptomyces rhizosphaericus]|uniref:Uncharacterized protein n=1 Tax=Streptomyces rhizosphaericus TaxID=114699 RepID=A0ABP4D8B0_9ACTN